MSDFTALAAPLAALSSCARRAACYQVDSPAYAVQERVAERTLPRVLAQGAKLTTGQPRHRKAVRTVLAAVEHASRCAESIRRRASADELVRRADAVERAARNVAELTAELRRQSAERVEEVVVGERPWTELTNVFDAFRSGQGRQPVQNQCVDESAAIATLSAGDEHASVPEQ
jgi:hypothetical protein